jgi:hypothetical protein
MMIPDEVDGGSRRQDDPYVQAAAGAGKSVPAASIFSVIFGDLVKQSTIITAKSGYQGCGSK